MRSDWHARSKAASRTVTIVPDPTAQEPFRFVVTAVYTVTGRGTVAAGLVQSGAVRAGNPLVVLHGDERLRTTCIGVEMIHARPPIDQRTIGLLLQDVRKDQVTVGDEIVVREE
jgi:translation elongation factor EF-Tu-like GTPase